MGSIPRVADYCSVIGRNVHLSNPPNDKVFVIGPSSCFGQGGKQPFCTILDDPNDDICKSLQGAPLLCKNNEVSGIVLGEDRSCVKMNGGKVQLRYHSIGDFRKWLDYHLVGPTTQSKSAMTNILSVKMIVLVLLSYIVMQ